MPVKILLAMGMAITAKIRLDEAAAPKARPFIAYQGTVVPMQEAPIEPSWILEGTPQARVSSSSPGFDGKSGVAIWDCTAGTFRWHFLHEETVVIMEGEVHVTAQDGTQRLLRVGDVAFFAAGTWATWRIDSYVRKVAHNRRPTPKAIAAGLKVARYLKRAVLARG